MVSSEANNTRGHALQCEEYSFQIVGVSRKAELEHTFPPCSIGQIFYL